MKIKQGLALLLMLSMLFALAACGGGSDPHEKELLLHLSFDEGKGLTVKDSSGNLPDTALNYELAHAAYLPEDQDPQWRQSGISGG